MTTLTFEDASPIPNTRGGRRPDPNPYTEIIAQIALKKGADGKPLAKRFVLEHETDDEETKATEIGRARRQLNQAGKDNDPAVTVQVRDMPAKKKMFGKETNDDDPKRTVITFWTIPLMTRNRNQQATTTTLTDNQEGQQ